MHHNPDLEPVPNVAIYNPKVQKAETDASNLAKRLLSIINSARIEDVQETVQKTLRPRFVRDPVSVVLHGETGTGKSFTLNNILGQRKIATQVSISNSFKDLCSRLVVWRHTRVH
jgi:predicted GTPase